MELDREMMKNLTDEQLQTIEYYMENEMKKLKLICYPIINRKFVPLSDHDDLFDDAINKEYHKLLANQLSDVL